MGLFLCEVPMETTVERIRRRKRESYHRLKHTRSPEYQARQAATKERYRARKRAEDIDGYRARANVASKNSRMRRLVEKAARPPGETCDVCGGPPNGRGRLHFDHCHTTDRFRGWLCHSCNIILGHAKDDATLLDKLAAYLRAQPDVSVTD